VVDLGISDSKLVVDLGIADLKLLSLVPSELKLLGLNL
jgi:hypothetical protein